MVAALSDSKEYGKLTSAQFAEFISYVPKLLDLIHGLGAHMSKVPAAQFDSLLPGQYGDYCHIYEESFIRHLSIVVVLMNRHIDLHGLAKAPDPQEALLEILRNMDEPDDDHPLFEGVEESMAMALIYSIGQTVTSMATYGRSISGLLHDARERGDLDALFKAIRMDRAVIGCPTAMQAHRARAASQQQGLLHEAQERFGWAWEEAVGGTPPDALCLHPAQRDGDTRPLRCAA